MNSQEYSYHMKLLQLIAILGVTGFLLFKATRGWSHVELHIHSLEWEHIQKELPERQARIEQDRQEHPDRSSAERREVERDILSGVRGDRV